MTAPMETAVEAPTETPTETQAETPREIGRASPTHSAADTVAEQPRTDRRQAKPAGTPQPRPQVAPAKKAGTAATTLPPAATQATAHPRPAPAQRTVSRPSLPYGVSEEDRAIWARAIEDAAKKFLSDPSEAGDTVRARALNSVARGLLTGAPDPASFRFQLPRTS